MTIKETKPVRRRRHRKPPEDHPQNPVLPLVGGGVEVAVELSQRQGFGVDHRHLDLLLVITLLKIQSLKTYI